jgi:hypothetical protein
MPEKTHPFFFPSRAHTYMQPATDMYVCMPMHGNRFVTPVGKKKKRHVADDTGVVRFGACVSFFFCFFGKMVMMKQNRKVPCFTGTFGGGGGSWQGIAPYLEYTPMPYYRRCS